MLRIIASQRIHQAPLLLYPWRSRPTGWIYEQLARDFVSTKTGRRDSIDIQEAEEFKTSQYKVKK